jgi:Family of unknown function (DUF5681)
MSASDPNGDGTYEVGHGKPPTHSQFQKGRSGNRFGRPRGSRNLKTLAKSILNGYWAVGTGEDQRWVPVTEVIVRSVTAKALAGDPKATAALLMLMQYEDADDSNELPRSGVLHHPVDDQNLAEWERMYGRKGRGMKRLYERLTAPRKQPDQESAVALLQEREGDRLKLNRTPPP